MICPDLSRQLVSVLISQKCHLNLEDDLGKVFVSSYLDSRIGGVASDNHNPKPASKISPSSPILFTPKSKCCSSSGRGRGRIREEQEQGLVRGSSIGKHLAGEKNCSIDWAPLCD